MDLSKLLPKQEAFVSDFKTRYLGFIGGFGSGKTTASCMKALYLSQLNPGCAGMLVSPTYPMMRDTTRRSMLQILDENKIAYHFVKSENKIILPEVGSEIWFRSADTPERLKGSSLAWAGLDEISQMSKEVWDITLSRVRDPNAKVLQTFVTSTPEGFNFLYDIFGVEKPGHRVIRSSSSENTYLDRSYVERLRESYDSKLASQYIDGLFVNIQSGLAYYGFSRDVHVKSCELNFLASVNVCCDFNVDPCVWLFVQEWHDQIHVVDEVCLRDTNTWSMSDKVKEQLGAWQSVLKLKFYGDYSGNRRSTNSTQSDWEIVRQSFADHPRRVEFNYYKGNPLVRNRVASVNAKLRNAKDKVQIQIDPKCKELIADFEQVTWVEGKYEIDKSNSRRTHASDALGYFIDKKHSLWRKEAMLIVR